jgi:hypothetical protein
VHAADLRGGAQMSIHFGEHKLSVWPSFQPAGAKSPVSSAKGCSTSTMQLRRFGERLAPLLSYNPANRIGEGR